MPIPLKKKTCCVLTHNKPRCDGHQLLQMPRGGSAPVGAGEAAEI